MPRSVHQNSTHGLRGGAEEMAATIPALSVVSVHQPQVSLMHQRCWLQSPVGRLVRHLLRGEPAKFLIDQRQELLGSVRVAQFDVRQNPRDIVHFCALAVAMRLQSCSEL